MQNNDLNKLNLSKETLRELTGRPLTAEEIDLVAGASRNPFAGCAGSTNCNSVDDYCPMR